MEQYSRYNYAPWVHRFTRAVDAEIDKLPEKPPPWPWPVYEAPVNQLRAVNEVLYAKAAPKYTGKPKPSGRKYLNSYVPPFVEESRARTEVYRGEDGDNFQLRVKKCWDDPRPWSIEGVVDPGSTVYLPFFREVTIRLPLKAKVCRKLEANHDGSWAGECRTVKKLNAREAIKSTTQWIMENGQGIRKINNEELTRNNDGAKTTGFGPAAHGSLLTAHSPGLAAYQAKQAARERPATRSRLERRLPLDGALHVEGFFPSTGVMRFTSPRELDRIAREYEEDPEMEVIRVMMQRPGMVYGALDGYVPAYLKQDDLDGYLVTEREVGPDPHHHILPDPRYRTMKWWRGYGRWGGKKKRLFTARERVARVKPSLKIVPTGPRSSELIITRRMHELSIGLKEALNLARMIEGAIKHRDPVKPERKPTWRQELRRRLVNDAGRFIWLIRNPIDTFDKGKWIVENERTETLNLGRVAEEALQNLKYRPCPALTELFPDSGLPKQYLDLVDRQWLTDDLNLFEAAPAGDFATKVEGFPVRLPVAVMPPAAYERWLAKGGASPESAAGGNGRCATVPVVAVHFDPPLFERHPCGSPHAGRAVFPALPE